MNSSMIKAAEKLLRNTPQVSDYTLNVSKKESFELFFVKGKLETLRTTDTCDRQATIYVDHDGFRGDAQFCIYPSADESRLQDQLTEAIQNALLIENLPYSLPEGETGTYTVPGDLDQAPMPELAERIADLVFAANTQEGGSINAVEIFIDHYTDSVRNSRGLQKSQTRWTAMVEAIPTFNGDRESVELYEQYNFSAFDPEALTREIAEKMADVKVYEKTLS